MIPAFFLLVGVFLAAKGQEYQDSGRDPFYWIMAIVVVAIPLVVGEVLT